MNDDTEQTSTAQTNADQTARHRDTGAYRPSAVQERPPDAATILQRLRTTYPHWAFLHDAARSTWTALRGREAPIVRRNPVALHAAVKAAQGGRSHLRPAPSPRTEQAPEAPPVARTPRPAPMWRTRG